MARDVNTPLVLWICAAVCAHFLLGEGGDTVAQFHDDRLAIATLGEKARERIRYEAQTFEVSSIDAPGKETAEAPPPPPEPSAEPTPPEKKKPEIPKPEPPKPQVKAPEPPQVEKKIAILPVPDDPAKKLEPPPPTDHRIAVRQHVQPNQEDNPNAHFIGDEANHVDKETASTQTSHDQDDPNPTPGGVHSGPDKRMGDSDQTKIAESEEHSGDKNRAPGEHGTEFDIQPLPPSERPQGSVTLPGVASTQVPRVGGDGRTPTPSLQPSQDLPGGAGPASPEVWSVAEGGGFNFNPMRPGNGASAANEQGPGQGNKPDQAPPSSTEWLGLGGKPGPGRANLNLNQTGVVASVGQDQLRKEREADGERRKSEHRGSWVASSFERWRSAIENYVSSVKPGNQTALNTAASPFATYLNGMHNRIHPIFADSFLGSLDALPKNSPLNDQKLITRLEIVLTKDGHIVRMGIVKASGVTAFDVAALDAVQRASPYGPAPSAIVSPDGRVYLHWEFHRDEVYACSTMNARPYLLNTPPRGAPTETPPGVPTKPGPVVPPLERGTPPPANLNETREGALPPAPSPETASAT
jgi:TonB family protein